MRRLILCLYILFSCIFCLGQEKSVRITLKSGTVLTGQLVELDPSSHLVLRIADIDSRIEMDSVSSIESENTIVASQQTDTQEPFVESFDGPSSFIIPLKGEQIEMVLINGGDFLMGYDGRGSRSFCSEPIHPVRLNSFYVSKTPVSIEQARIILEKKNIGIANSFGNYAPSSWNFANTVAEKLAEHSGLPVHMITEAQWEYIATSKYVKSIIYQDYEYEWCYDLFDTYPETEEPVLNPSGPETGYLHTFRGWFSEKNEYYKRNKAYSGNSIGAVVRIVLQAADYK